VQCDGCDSERGREARDPDQDQVEDQLVTVEFDEAGLERDREEEGSENLRARLRHAKLLQQLVPVAVGALVRGLGAAVIEIVIGDRALVMDVDALVTAIAGIPHRFFRVHPAPPSALSGLNKSRNPTGRSIQQVSQSNKSSSPNNMRSARNIASRRENALYFDDDMYLVGGGQDAVWDDT